MGLIEQFGDLFDERILSDKQGTDFISSEGNKGIVYVANWADPSLALLRSIEGDRDKFKEKLKQLDMRMALCDVDSAESFAASQKVRGIPWTNFYIGDRKVGEIIGARSFELYISYFS